MAAKKKTTKPPSPAQLRARRAFAAAAKARSKKAKNSSRRRNSTGDVTSPTRTEVRSPTKTSTTTDAYTADNVTVTGGAGAGATTKVIIRSNGKKRARDVKNPMVVMNKATRRKYRNGYLDLVIRGTAEKTAAGWKVGKKIIAQGKGIAPISSGYYLDRATGTIFAKRARNSTKKRNADHKDSDHPIEVTHHYRSGPPGYLTPWQRAHHAGQKDLFAHGITPAKKRNSSYDDKRRKYLIEKVRKRVQDMERNHLPAAREGLRLAQAKLARLRKDKAERWQIQEQLGFVDYKRRDLKQLIGQINEEKRSLKKRNPSPADNRREFAGRYSGNKDLFFPQGTPSGLSKLGKLVLIKTDAGDIKPVRGSVWLCQDAKGKLHLGSTTQAPLFDGAAQNFGQVKRLEYEESKPHLGYPNPVVWFHKMGETTGERPTLHSDGKGGLKFRGGRYRITSRGIEN